MANERLRAAFMQAGVTPEQVARQLKVDPKTIERWIGGRVPYRRSRYALARQLGADEAYLWPDALTPDQVGSASESEILVVYPHRYRVPHDIWGRVFDSAEKEISILVYSGLFLADDGGFLSLFREKAEAGVKVRIILGDPEGTEIIARGEHEGTGEALSAKIRNVMFRYSRIRDVDGVEIRTHNTILYNSIYRGDDDLLVNTHIYGMEASDAPVLYLRRVSGGKMVTTYLESFEQVWASAQPLA